MQAELSGDAGLAASASPGTVSGSIDVEDSLGIDEEGSGYVRAEAGVSFINVTASAFQYDSSGTGVLQANFGNIPAGITVDTDLEIIVVKGALHFDVLDLGFLRLSPGVAVDYFGTDLTATAVGAGFSEDLDIDVPVPMPFLQTEVIVGPVAATLEGGAMAVDYSDVEGTYIDLEGLVRWTPLPHVEVFGGYRWIDADTDGTADGQDYDADVTLQGWMVGGGFTF
jgi:hypothetical protein